MARSNKIIYTLFLFMTLITLFGCMTKIVTITSDPSEAVIYIDGMEKGITPFSGEVEFKSADDKKNITATKGACYELGKITVAYKPTDKQNYYIKLKQACKEVFINSYPIGATISLNGAESGIAPFKKKLNFSESEEYIALAQKDGYEDGQRIITLDPITLSEYTIHLKKKEAVYIDLVLIEPKLTDKGVKLIISKRPTLAYLEVIERSPNVVSVTRITNNEDSTVQIGSPVMSPISDSLVYWEFFEEKDGNSYSNIWKQTVGLSAKTRVTYGKWSDFFPCFTPSGQELIFSSNRTSSNVTLWRIRIKGGGGITKITNTLAEDYSPSVSFDNTTIAYASNPPSADEPQIWTVNADGSLPTQLREGDWPHISPDGKKIVFVRRDKISRKKQIWVMNADGSSETQMTQNIDYDAFDPKWSPDGYWIAYCSEEGRDSKKLQNPDIWMMSYDGSAKVQLTTNGSWDDRPCWDQNGEFIYFRSNRGVAWNIWRFKPVMYEEKLEH